MADPEGSFLRKIASLIPAAAGYRAAGARAETDRLVRGHVGAGLERLKARIEELKEAAREEGEEDMLDDLDRIGERMGRTIDSLRSADFSDVPFFAEPAATDNHIGRVSSYDKALLEDLELLTTDVMGMKYETIGNLTLREAEGTLAAIELKVTNRRDAFETAGDD